MFVVLAWAARGPSVLRGDVRLARWIQGGEWPGFDPLMEAANWSMRSGPLVVAALIIAGGLVWRGDLMGAVALVAAVAIMHASYLLKEIVASPRPTADLVEVMEPGGGYGFPGGRAGNAVLLIGVLAWLLARRIPEARWRMTVWGGWGIWVIVTGMARVRGGAHWPSDILGAWLWSIPALIVITWAAGRRRPLTG
jgi:undecaprenyl-diphosphatase